MKDKPNMKWAYSKDGKVRFAIPLDAPDIVENWYFEEKTREILNRTYWVAPKGPSDEVA